MPKLNIISKLDKDGITTFLRPFGGKTLNSEKLGIKSSQKCSGKNNNLKSIIRCRMFIKEL